MPRDPDRRDVLKTTAKLAAASALAATPGSIAGAREQAARSTRIQSVLDPILRAASQDGDLPGVVAMIANDSDVVYEGMFGTRRLPAGPAMTRDTVFRVASMDGSAVWKGLLDRSVLIRDVSDWPGLEGCLRVTIGTPLENDRFLAALREVLALRR